MTESEAEELERLEEQERLLLEELREKALAYVADKGYTAHMRLLLFASLLRNIDIPNLYVSAEDMATAFAKEIKPVIPGFSKQFLLLFPQETKETHEYFYGVLDVSVNPLDEPEHFFTLMHRKSFNDLLRESESLQERQTLGYPGFALDENLTAAICNECGFPSPDHKIHGMGPESLICGWDRTSEGKEEEITKPNSERSKEMHINAWVDPVEGKEYFRGRAKITLNDILTIENLTVWAKKDKSLYVKMPEKDGLPKDYEGNRDMAYPLTKELREKISARVVTEYNRAIETRNQIAVTVYPVDNGTHVKANATAVFDDSFVVTGISLMENKDGELFMTMPRHSYTSPTTGEKEYRDAVSLPPYIKGELKAKVFAEYENATAHGPESNKGKPVGLIKSNEKDIRGEALAKGNTIGGKSRGKQSEAEL